MKGELLIDLNDRCGSRQEGGCIVCVPSVQSLIRRESHVCVAK